MRHRDTAPMVHHRLILLLLVAGLLATIWSPSLHATLSGHLFDAPFAHNIRGDPEALATGDFNNDGRIDAAVANASGELIVCLGDGDGRFSILGVDSAGYQKTGVAAGDLDGDGALDLVASYYDWWDYYYGDPESGGVSLVLGHGDGTFTDAVSLLEGDHLPQDLALGDLDGDNRLDLAVVLVPDNSVAILMGQGDGTFSEQVTCAVGDEPTALELADLDGDGDTDLVATNGLGNSVSILLNNGDGTFPAAVAYPAGYHPVAIAVVDLDQAGGPDLAVANMEASVLSVLFGTGSGTFSAPVTYGAGSAPCAVAAGDINGDGHADLALSSDDSPSVQLFFNDGSGGLAPGVSQPAPHRTADLAIEDLDGDGDQDLCLATAGIFWWTSGGYHQWTGDYFGRLSVLLNYGAGEFPAPGSHAVGHGPTALALGDLSENGNTDLVAADGSQLWVLPGDGDATFGEPVGYGENYRPDDMVLSDLNGDGHLDAAAVSSTATLVFLGSGDGTLTLAGSMAPGAETLHVDDLDLDGDPDLVLVNDQRVQFLLGNGDGTFQLSAFVIEAAGFDYAYTAAVGLLNGDAVPDLAVRYIWTDDFFWYSSVDVWFGVGDGTFSPGETTHLGGYFGPLQLCDLDLDGHQDLILARTKNRQYNDYFKGSRVSLRWGNGDGTFASGPSYITGIAPSAVLVDDLNGNGWPDLAVTNTDSRNVAVLLNNGDRSFVEGESYACGSSPQCLDAADLDGDGDLELVTGNTGSNDVSVLINLSRFPFLVTGPGRGESNPPLVRMFDLSRGCAMRRQWQAYGVSRYGVNVACADLDGDGLHEILTGPGPGEMFGPHVRGFEDSGEPIPGISFLAYGTNRYGVNVAGADLDGDGRQEILTGAGPGAVFGPHVRGWRWDGTATAPIPGISYFAYGTLKWGVNVTGGDIDGDGFDEIITGAGPGSVYGPHVRGWDWDGESIAPIGQVSYLAYGTNHWGVNVCAGDIDGDGIDEIVTGAGPSGGFSPNVRGWNWDGSGSVTMIPGLDFFAYSTLQWGVNVSCGDLDGDGIDEILTGRGPGSTFHARVRGFNYDGVTLAPMPGVDFTAYDPAVTLHGAKAAAGRSRGSPGR